MKIPNQSIVSFIQKIQKDKSRQIVIVPHVNPDGDAIGSSIALYQFFLATNKVQIIVPSEFPQFLKWLPNSDKVIHYKDNLNTSQKYISEANLIIILDHNAPDRSGDLELDIANSQAKKLMIDHHPEPSYPVDFQISSIDVSSTAELIYNFISQINPSAIDTHIASAIYTGIMTDTGNFMHNIHSETFSIVSELMKQKIDRDFIYDQIFNNYSLERMQLLGYTLSQKMDVLKSLGVVILSLNKSELEQFNYQTGDTEGFVNMPLSIQGINVSILVMEKDQEIKLSFRSKGNIAINTIAKTYFNGGGHKNAAGGTETVEDNIESTLLKLKKILENHQDLLANIE